MLNRIKKYIATSAATLVLLLSLSPGLALAASDVTIQGSTCQGAKDLQFEKLGAGSAKNTCQDNDIKNSTDTVNDLIAKVINIFSVVVGIVAVIMIVYGGFRYITSGGDSGKVTSARNTILYAIIGLIIVALAQFVVKFVLSKATNT